MVEERESAATLLAELIHFLDRTGLLRNSPVVEEPEVLTKARVAIVKILAIELERDRLRKALEFYADPETYFGIGFFPDPPCGDFMADFEETEELGMKPGKHARAALAPDTAKEPGT